MSSVINVLDEITANKIAAGEVVERPASCVKELVENAIDANSDEIEVEIANGGVDYMRVTDNGSGMSAEDAKLSIIRHATSKIQSVDDIFSISSLGFRGEALPSIASVSRFKMTTRQLTSEFATYLEMEAGKILQLEETGGNVGTTIEVSDLFFNTPARRKFLKSERTEGNQISAIITKLALAHPQIGFKLINNGHVSLQTAGRNNLRDTLAGIYGTELAKELFPIAYEGENISITGYVGKPSILKSTRQWQTCIVNHRVINSRIVYKAIDNAYHAMLPKSGYPVVVLNIQIPAEVIDVNVHPQKTEIKFSDEQLIYRAVYHSAVNALISQDTPVAIATTITGNADKVFSSNHVDFPPTDTESFRAKASRELHNEDPMDRLSDTIATGYGDGSTAAVPITVPVVSTSRGSGYIGRSSDSSRPIVSSDDALALTHLFEAKKLADTQEETPGDGLFENTIVFENDTIIMPLGQVANCYIVAKKGDDLYVIDQHAAHERIRYDKFCERIERLPVQQLLVPEFVTLDGDDMEILEREKETFYDLGFTYKCAGPNMIRVEETPHDLATDGIADALKTIFVALHESHQPNKAELRHRVLAYASCHGAVKAGDTLNMREIKLLIDELFNTAKPFVCPHGRPIIIRFTAAELAKLFHRT